jgi:DNA polymerase V
MFGGIENDTQEGLDLNEFLIKHPSATFFLRVSGSAMIKAGIHHNDILIVDRSIEPTNGKIVIAVVNEELTVKRLRIEGNKMRVFTENDPSRSIDITNERERFIWGVVTNVIRRFYSCSRWKNDMLQKGS